MGGWCRWVRPQYRRELKQAILVSGLFRTRVITRSYITDPMSYVVRDCRSFDYRHCDFINLWGKLHPTEYLKHEHRKQFECTDNVNYNV